MERIDKIRCTMTKSLHLLFSVKELSSCCARCVMSYDKLFGRFGYNVHTSISKQLSGLHTDFCSSEFINRAESA